MKKVLILLILALSAISLHAQNDRPNDTYMAEDLGYFTALIPTDYGIVASTNQGNEIYLLNDNSAQLLITSPGCGRYINLHADGQHVLFKYIDKEYNQQPAMIDLTTGKLFTLTEPQYLCGQPIMAANGDLLLPFDQTMTIIRKDGNRENISYGNYSNYMAFSPDGKFICHTNTLDQPILINLETKESTVLTSNTAYLPSFSHDGKYLAWGTSPENVVIYNLENGVTKTLSGNAFDWHPFENKLVFQQKKINEHILESCQILEYDAEANSIIPLTNGTDIAMGPVYDKNGHVYYHNQTGLEIFKVSEGNTSSEYKHSGVLKRHFYNPVRNTQANTTVPGHVPYVHQVYDTPSWHAGWGSCAPTTCIMAIAYYNRLPAWPVSVDHGYSWDPHVNDFGSYVADRYRFNEWYYQETADAYGTTAYGGYGYMWKTGYSPNSSQRDYLEAHYMGSNQYWTTSCNYDSTIQEINNGYVHPLCNYLTASGHLTLCIGYVQGQHTLVFNDPYGDKNTPGYPSYDGDSVYYDWPGYNNGFENLGGGYSYIAWSTAARTYEPTYNDTIIDNNYYGHGFYVNNSTLGSHMRYFRDFNSGYNGHTWFTLGMATTPDICYTTWTPNIVDTAWMKISAFIPPEGSNTLSAMYHITSLTGDTVVTVSQNANKNTWVELGIFQLAPGAATVYLGDSTGVTGDSIAFDAMKFEYMNMAQAGFYANNFHICGNDTVIFTSTAQYNDTVWWDFDGGQLWNTIGNNYYVTFPAAGVYDITQYVGGAYGNDTLLMSSYITVYEDVMADFTPTADSIPLSNALVGFTNTSTGAISYEWSFGDGNFSNQQDPFHTYTAVGDYEVKLIAVSAHCPSDSTTDIIHVYLATGIEEPEDIAVLLYPNPAQDFVYLQNSEDEELTWQLYDATARLIRKGVLPNGELKLSIIYLAKGLYSIRISGENIEVVLRLIKE